jgi:hypothetical protein
VSTSGAGDLRAAVGEEEDVCTHGDKESVTTLCSRYHPSWLPVCYRTVTGVVVEIGFNATQVGKVMSEMLDAARYLHVFVVTFSVCVSGIRDPKETRFRIGYRFAKEGQIGRFVATNLGLRP